jgi:hypothetical protein
MTDTNGSDAKTPIRRVHAICAGERLFRTLVRHFLRSGSRVRILPDCQAHQSNAQVTPLFGAPSDDLHDARPPFRARCMPDRFGRGGVNSPVARLLIASAMARCRSLLPYR